MKNPKFHGITSLLLMTLATLLGLIVMSLTSWLLGGLYLAAMVIVPQALLRTFCAKCPCKTHCKHVWPGRAALAVAKTPGPYTPTELIILVGSMGLLFGLPQFWLWAYPPLFITFWVLTSSAVTQIRLAICPTCSNMYCPLHAKAH